jgi:hypothetical protein
VILRVHFEGTHYVGYDYSPTHVDIDGTVYITGEAEAEKILGRIQAACEALR